MDRRILIVVIVALSAAAYLLLRREEPAKPADWVNPGSKVVKTGPASAPEQTAQRPLPERNQSSVIPGMVIQRTDPSKIAPPRQDTPNRPPVEESAAKVEVGTLALNLRDYGHRFGGNPSGTNAEIVKALTGRNPNSVRFLASELSRLNGQGELVDRWGTPYFFHQLSKEHTEVRSAGPDLQMWTSDDVVE